MIGGNDIIYKRRLSSEMLDFVLRMFRGFWPEATVAAHDSTNDSKSIRDVIRDTLGGVDGFFVFKTKEAEESWELIGAGPVNDDMMIYVLMGEDSTTFVVSDSLPTGAAMVADIILALDVNFPRRDR